MIGAPKQIRTFRTFRNNRGSSGVSVVGGKALIGEVRLWSLPAVTSIIKQRIKRFGNWADTSAR